MFKKYLAVFSLGALISVPLVSANCHSLYSTAKFSETARNNSEYRDSATLMYDILMSAGFQYRDHFNSNNPVLLAKINEILAALEARSSSPLGENEKPLEKAKERAQALQCLQKSSFLHEKLFEARRTSENGLKTKAKLDELFQAYGLANPGSDYYKFIAYLHYLDTHGLMCANEKSLFSFEDLLNFFSSPEVASLVGAIGFKTFYRVSEEKVTSPSQTLEDSHIFKRGSRQPGYPTLKLSYIYEGMIVFVTRPSPDFPTYYGPYEVREIHYFEDLKKTRVSLRKLQGNWMPNDLELTSIPEGPSFFFDSHGSPDPGEEIGI